MRALLAALILCLCASLSADAHLRWQYRLEAHRPWFAPFHWRHARRRIHYRRERFADHGGLTHARLADGQVIVVASAYATRFVGFFNALYHREGRLPRIACYAPHGHMRHSLHHWGGACDVGQTERNVAPRMMYHVTALARDHGLTDGCTFHHGGPDCGHVDVSGSIEHVARHRRHHYRYARR